MKDYHKVMLIAPMIVFGGAEIQAKEKNTPLSLSAGAGFEIDSNLTVDAIDTNSNIGDEAFIFDATAGFDFVDNEKTRLSAGYDFYYSAHGELETFDMVIHGVNVDGGYTVGRTDFGLTLMYNDISLGGDDFLGLTTVRPNIGYLLESNKVYLIGSYEYQKQDFDQVALMARDSKRHSFSVKSIFILGGGRTVTTGYEFSNQDAMDQGFSYNGHLFDVSLKLPIDIFNRETIVRSEYRFQSRGYDDASLNYNPEVRDDKRHTISAKWEIPIKNGFKGEVEFEYINSNSNYSPIDYNESVTSFRIGWEY